MIRDAGLERISAVTRWSIAAVVALSGTLALLAAGGFPGHAPASRAAPQSASPASSSGLQPPSQALAQAPAAALVVSGGS